MLRPQFIDAPAQIHMHDIVHNSMSLKFLENCASAASAAAASSRGCAHAALALRACAVCAPCAVARIASATRTRGRPTRRPEASASETAVCGAHVPVPQPPPTLRRRTTTSVRRVAQPAPAEDGYVSTSGDSRWSVRSMAASPDDEMVVLRTGGNEVSTFMPSGSSPVEGSAEESCTSKTPALVRVRPRELRGDGTDSAGELRKRWLVETSRQVRLGKISRAVVRGCSSETMRREYTHATFGG